MLNQSAFNAEPKRRPMFQRVRDKIIIFAHADDGNPAPATDPATDPAPINFEQAIAQARKEEKDKLYPRIKKLEDENKSLTTSVNKYLLENAALKDEMENMKSQPADPKIKELEDKVKTLEDENKTLKENAPNEEEIRKKIESEYEVKLYAQEQINANKGSIISILIPDIKGSTKEEIDSAIASAKEKTISIKKDLGIEVDEDGDKNKSKNKSKEQPAKQTKAPPANPASDEDGEEYDADYIRNLDPRSKEYAEFRKKLGLR